MPAEGIVIVDQTKEKLIMEFITSRKINNRLYQLNELITDQIVMHMYLVVGNERAALIDTGYGLSGQLRNVVESITNKPVIVLLSHSDPDHAGAAAQFDEIYMSEKEKTLLDAGSISQKVRLGNAQAVVHDPKRMDYFKKNLVKAETFSFKPLEDGQLFDLGGVTLEAIAFPGHTAGSFCFWNEKENYCLVGDSVANVASPILFFTKCLPLSVYKDNLHKFLDKVGEDCDIYTGHNEEKLDKKLFPEIFAEINEILAGDTENDEPYLPPFLKPVVEQAPSPEAGAAITKQVLGDTKAMEHKHPGYTATIKYNANKLC